VPFKGAYAPRLVTRAVPLNAVAGRCAPRGGRAADAGVAANPSELMAVTGRESLVFLSLVEW